MFVILTYDVNSKRVGKALKICRKYLSHVQRSVFEGNITEGKLRKLQKELQRVHWFRLPLLGRHILWHSLTGGAHRIMAHIASGSHLSGKWDSKRLALKDTVGENLHGFFFLQLFKITISHTSYIFAFNSLSYSGLYAV